MFVFIICVVEGNGRLFTSSANRRCFPEKSNEYLEGFSLMCKWRRARLHTSLENKCWLLVWRGKRVCLSLFVAKKSTAHWLTMRIQACYTVNTCSSSPLHCFTSSTHQHMMMIHQRLKRYFKLWHLWQRKYSTWVKLQKILKVLLNMQICKQNQEKVLKVKSTERRNFPCDRH